MNEIAIGLDDLLQAGPHPAAGGDHGLPVEVGEDLHDRVNQGLLGVMRGPIDVPLSHAPHKKVQGIKIRRARRLKVFGPEVREILLAPILHLLGRLGWCTIHGLSPATWSIQGLTTFFRTLRYTSVLTLRPASNMWGGHDVALVADHAQHHDHRRELGGHDNRDFRGVRTKPAVVFLVDLLVLAEVLLIGIKNEDVLGRRLPELPEEHRGSLGLPLLKLINCPLRSE